MKAESVVMSGLQKPYTLFGVPPFMFVIVGTAAMAAFGLFVALDVISLALVVAIIVFVAGWLALFRQTRADHHFDNYLFKIPRFWRGRGQRYMIAGIKNHVG